MVAVVWGEAVDVVVATGGGACEELYSRDGADVRSICGCVGLMGGVYWLEAYKSHPPPHTHTHTILC